MSEEIDRREPPDFGGKALQFHAGKPKMSGSQQVVEHPRDPDHSEPVREVRTMADTSQYSDSAQSGKTEPKSNTWKSLGDLASALVERAAQK